METGFPKRSCSTKMLPLLDDAEGAACRRIVIAGNAIAVLRDDRSAALQPLLVALGGARLIGLVSRLRHGPDIRIAGGPYAQHTTHCARRPDATADIERVGVSQRHERQRQRGARIGGSPRCRKQSGTVEDQHLNSPWRAAAAMQ